MRPLGLPPLLFDLARDPLELHDLAADPAHADLLAALLARVQGGQLKAKREIRIATLFRDVPAEFLRMITVHELAHLRVRAHDKAFYQLCVHMEPDYHQYEFDLRAYLSYRDAGGEALWGA